MASPLRVQCPICKTYLDTTGERLGIDSEANTVTMVLDVSALQDHVRKCTAVQPVQPPPALELPRARPLPAFKDVAPAFIMGGRRACTGCGTPNGQCLRSLEALAKAAAKGGPNGACCAMCAEGDTHPVVAGDLSCAEWGVKHGAQN